MRRRVLSIAAFLSGIALVALVASPEAAAFQKGKKNKGKDDDGIITNWGKPKAFEPGKPAHYWLWYDDGLWRIRTTTASKRHHFVGKIEVAGGKFNEILGWNGERAEKRIRQLLDEGQIRDPERVVKSCPQEGTGGNRKSVV